MSVDLRPAVSAALRPIGALLISLALLLPALPANAANITSNVSPDISSFTTRTGNVYYAYVEVGEWVQLYGSGGTASIYTAEGLLGSGGVTGGLSAPREVQPGQEGVWTFAFGGSTNWGVTVYDGDPETDVNTPPWTVTPPAGVNEITGRVWTESYSIAQGGGSLKDLNFWVLNDSGYQYELNLTGYSGISSVIEANSMGIPAGTTGGLECTPSYMSLDAPANPEESPDMECADPFRMFFEEPAADLPVSAPIAPTDFNGQRTTQVIKPEPVDPATLTAQGFDFLPAAPGQSAAGTFSYDLGDQFFGGHLLQIDVDGNGSFGDAVDREIRVGASGAPVSFAFDGLDGTGAAIEPCTPLEARVFFDRIGEMHVVQTDVEARAGIEVIRQNGPGAPDATLYWDDTNTSTERVNGINPPSTADGTAGVDSTGGVHGWDYHVDSWGNEKYIDDWSYLPADRVGGSLAFNTDCLGLTKTASTDAAQPGDVVDYTVEVTNDGTEDYTVDAPLTVADELAAVLDDATWNDDAAAAVDGEPMDAPTLTGDRLVWSGPLATGETLEITYTVTVTGAGDRVGRNVAFVPPSGADPLTFDAPDCTTGGGFDPDTGVFCGATEFQMPRLSVEKTSDEALLPAVGETASYTVTATNTGAGAYTTTNPAFVVDDLAGVVDDATVVEDSLQASRPGTLTLEGDRIVWSGPLAPNQSVIITYDVTYTGEGDSALVNVAFGPQGPELPAPVCDPRTPEGTDPVTGLPCDVHRLPGSGLTVQKSVDPASGTNVAPGDVLTYRLTFANNGQAPATVDHVDQTGGLRDDAEVSGASTDSPLAITEDTQTGTIGISGTVPVGEAYTVTYTATVRELEQQGDHVLANYLTEEGEAPPTECVPGSELCTVNFVPNLVVTKTADPATGTSVQSGDELTYTLAFANTGAGVVDVARIDDLSGVLDDAALTAGPTVQNLVALTVGDELVITGAVGGGSVETVTYAVTVCPDGEHGDNVLSNVVLLPGQVPPAECDPTVTPCTTHPVGELAAVKSVDPASGTTVEAGDLLRYTLAFENVGTGDYTVEAVDDARGVLDDADLTEAAAVTGGPLSVGSAEPGQFLITGVLAPEATSQVEYAVTVRADGQRGDDVVGNYLFGPGWGVDRGECAEASPYCTSNRVESASIIGSLPVVGSNAGPWTVALGAMLLGAGLVLLRARRGARA